MKDIINLIKYLEMGALGINMKEAPHSFFIPGRRILLIVAGALRVNNFKCAMNKVLNATCASNVSRIGAFI
jgi:hypothetical protein